MEWLLVLLALAAGAAAGWYLAHARGLAARARLEASIGHESARAEAALAQAREERERLQAAQEAQTRLEAENARLGEEIRQEKARIEETKALLDQTEGRFRDAFKALSADALKDNKREFLDLAQRDVLAPIKESLEKVGVQVQALEQARAEAYGGLTEQVKSLAQSQERLHSETENLVRALRSPQTRGRWGEIQLQRVVEVSGMVEYCDFETQKSVSTEDGRLRPDMIVRLPGGKNVVVDAKVPLMAYMDAWEATTEDARRAKLKDHARLIRDHMKKLSVKGYSEQFEATPEWVVMFLPGESLFSAALEQDPELMEEGFKQRVLLATPTTLIALLRSFAHSWQQAKITENARKISDLGRQLYDRLKALGGHFAKLGRGLSGALDAYNDAVGSLERSVLPSARRFSELGAVGTDDLPALNELDKSVRRLQAPELLEKPDGDQEAR